MNDIVDITLESIEEATGISADFVVLAVVWDEVNGPTIISKSPVEGLADPINIALQIYLSSVAVFGQHSQTTRIDFSLPLLSISPNHLVHVAFDSWPDSEVRGDERPFFLGFIMDREKDKMLGDFIQKNLWSWMDNLKSLKQEFQTQIIFDELLSFYQTKTSKLGEEIFKESTKEETSYSKDEALKDLENASDLWTKNKDRSVLNSVLRSAYRLEGNQSGNAYFLAGVIFFNSGDYDNALESYNRATESFKKDPSPEGENVGESMFNAAISAYRLEKFEIAQSNLVLSSSFLKDSMRKARMFLYLAQTQFRLQDYENASNSFEIAVDNALEADDPDLAGQVFSVYASRLQERANSTEDASLKFTLLELSAVKRGKASEYFSIKNLNVEAGTSLVLASKTYQTIKNYDLAIKKLEQASELFLKDSDYSSAGRTLFDVIDLYKHLPKIAKEDIVELSDRATEVISKISEENIRVPLLAKLVKEKAKIFESINDYRNAIENYEELYSKSVNAPLTNELLSVFLSYANLLFQLENYKKSGEIFFKIYSQLTVNNDRDRSDRVKKNANVSFKRAVTSFLYAGTVLLHNNDAMQELIVDYFDQTVSMLQMVYNTSPENEKNNNITWINQNLKSLKLKALLLSNESKTIILKRISDLNI